jgi:SIR2-like protein
VKQSTQDLPGASHSLEADIRRGVFTPFLGAGASSLWSGEIDLESYPWKQVTMTLTAISFRLSERSLDFLRSFTQHRLNLSSGEANRIIPTTDNQCLAGVDDKKLGESLLVKLQAELVRATVRLTNYFGVRFSQENPSIYHLENYCVEFDLGSEDVVGGLARDCPARLFAAADIALELQSKRSSQRESPFLDHVPGAHRCLEIQRLYDKLLILIINLIGRNREVYQKELAKHSFHRYEVEQGRAVSSGKLRLDAIQWLSDLLWYTVRYWVPCYPTTAELAFELSLAVKDAPPRRAELAQAAQALENLGSGDAAEIVGKLVAYCESVQERREGPDRQTRAFYYSIAAVLQYQFERYERAGLDAQFSFKDRFRADRWDEDGVSNQAIPVPIAFTTNFDNALERVFEANDISFHIIFPVLRGADKWKAVPCWQVATHCPKSENQRWVVQDWSSLLDINDLPKIEFQGPVIVKLHGSPSLKLENATRHCIVLSEFSYLQVLASRAPLWLTRGFREEMGHSLWFLGNSISDWNVRLRLYEDFGGLRGLRRGWSTVTQDVDIYRTAILERLGVDQHLGDLNDFPGIVLRVLGDDDTIKSLKVSRLVAKLKELY